MILITGATGTVGSRLVELLVARGEDVRVFSRNAEAARSRLGDEVEIAEGDFGDPDSLLAALDGADRLFLLTTTRAAKLDTQREHERNIIAAATQAGTAHVVKQSVLGADARSPMSYARGHSDVERELEASSLPTTILRPAAFMQGFFETVTDDGSIYTCAEDGRVAMVDARDIAAVAAAALTGAGHEGKTYTLTGPAAITYDEAAAVLSAAAGRRIKHVRVPAEGLVEAMTGAGLALWFAEDLAAQFGVFAAGEGAETSDDVEAVTGRPPRSLDDFARGEFAIREENQNEPVPTR